MLILNDIHIGVQRQAGTTPESREALRSYLFASLIALLATTEETHLLINGDLFDEFEVPTRDIVDTYRIFNTWVSHGNHLTLVAGNHDHSPKALRMSSFQLLATILKEQSPNNVTVVGIDTFICRGDYSILAHCSNQDMFDAKLAELLAVAGQGHNLLLHANFDNNFAAESDHSLNVSREVARAFVEKRARLIFAHEHQAKLAMGEKVFVMGNQWPTSVADCLGNDKKFAHILSDAGEVTKVETWSAAAGFAEIDWRELGAFTGEQQFLRIAGNASSSEASEVINLIAKFRSKSKAFVITNSVKIDGVVLDEELPATFDAVKKFEVMSFIKSLLDDDQNAAVDKLMEGQQ